MDDDVEFYLPLGLLWEDKIYRRGRMHPATTADELSVQDSDDAAMNVRYRDLLLLARVIDEFEDLKSVSVEMIENLYEADFLYLQILYQELNGEPDGGIVVSCPKCGAISQVDTARLYENMDLYRVKGDWQNAEAADE